MDRKQGIFVGMSTIDIIYRVTKYPPPNSKLPALTQMVLAGGPATNAAITFSHLGGSATLVTAIGRHPLTHIMMEELERFSVGYIDLYPSFDDVPTISSIIVLDDGSRTVLSTNATRIASEPSHVEPTGIDGASVLLVDGHYMESCIDWAREARARHVSVVLDGGSWKPRTEELLQWVDIAICSADFHPSSCQTSEGVLAFLRSCGVPFGAVTRGEDPIRYFTGDDSGEIPVRKVPVVDTLGAGDIFHGAFCSFYSQRPAFAEALADAAAVATESTRYPGTRVWMEHVSSQAARK